jgi:hypothetical protein
VGGVARSHKQVALAKDRRETGDVGVGECAPIRDLMCAVEVGDRGGVAGAKVGCASGHGARLSARVAALAVTACVSLVGAASAGPCSVAATLVDASVCAGAAAAVVVASSGAGCAGGVASSVSIVVAGGISSRSVAVISTITGSVVVVGAAAGGVAVSAAAASPSSVCVAGAGASWGVACVSAASAAGAFVGGIRSGTVAVISTITRSSVVVGAAAGGVAPLCARRADGDCVQVYISHERTTVAEKTTGLILVAHMPVPAIDRVGRVCEHASLQDSVLVVQVSEHVVEVGVCFATALPRWLAVRAGVPHAYRLSHAGVPISHWAQAIITVIVAMSVVVVVVEEFPDGVVAHGRSLVARVDRGAIHVRDAHPAGRAGVLSLEPPQKAFGVRRVVRDATIAVHDVWGVFHLNVVVADHAPLIRSLSLSLGLVSLSLSPPSLSFPLSISRFLSSSPPRPSLPLGPPSL